MARVVVVGAGIAGLSAEFTQLPAAITLFCLKRNQNRRPSTSQNIDGFSLHYGPHLADKSGPFFRM